MIIIIIFSLESFSHQRELMSFHWSLRESKSPQVSRTLLSILADINNAVVWMVSTRPFISSPPVPVTDLSWLYQAHQLLYSYWCNEQQTQEDFFNKIYIPLPSFVRVQTGYSGFACERELEIEPKL